MPHRWLYRHGHRCRPRTTGMPTHVPNHDHAAHHGYDRIPYVLPRHRLVLRLVPRRPCRQTRPYRGTTIRIISELFDDRLRVVVEKPSVISQQFNQLMLQLCHPFIETIAMTGAGHIHCDICNHRVRTIQLGDIGQHNMRSNTGDGAHWGRG